MISMFPLQKVKRLRLQSMSPNALVSPTEVRNTFRSLRLTKVAGPDPINNSLEFG
jgi:hypothetical protein